MIIMSCVVYGMAFDFFNISGSLFVETNTDQKNRSSAQGLLMMMNGFGAVLGSLLRDGLLINILRNHLTILPELAGFLETETTNSK
jgi:NHS family xanthosine MFS transporter